MFRLLNECMLAFKYRKVISSRLFHNAYTSLMVATLSSFFAVKTPNQSLTGHNLFQVSHCHVTCIQQEIYLDFQICAIIFRTCDTGHHVAHSVLSIRARASIPAIFWGRVTACPSSLLLSVTTRFVTGIPLRPSSPISVYRCWKSNDKITNK